MKYLPPCESAKKGRVCFDDICRGSDITLCGFDKEAWDEMSREYESDENDIDGDWPSEEAL